LCTVKVHAIVSAPAYISRAYQCSTAAVHLCNNNVPASVIGWLKTSCSNRKVCRVRPPCNDQVAAWVHDQAMGAFIVASTKVSSIYPVRSALVKLHDTNVSPVFYCRISLSSGKCTLERTR